MRAKKIINPKPIRKGYEMAVKKTIELKQSEEQSTIAFDETHDFGGKQVRFVIDLQYIQSDIAEYATRLKKHRKVKGDADLEFLTYEDAVVQVAYENFEDVFDEDERMELAIETAKDHYAELLEGLTNEAFMLAITAENDFSDTEVQPYEEENNTRVLPGIGKPLPLPKRDIRFSTEKRLAQLYLIVFRDLAKWQSLRNRIIVQASKLLQKQGKSRLDGSTF